jgi:23S rRNA (uracil1939-C5)-methyltransferase
MKRPFRPQPERAIIPADPPPPPRELVFEVSGIGGQGDGIAEIDGQQVFVPWTLPGETVRARVAGSHAWVDEVVTASPERVLPPCTLFGRCGGCALQHWAEDPMLAWKAAQVQSALERRGLETEIRPTIAAWGDGRRRATLQARRDGKRIRLGFMRRGTHAIEEPQSCTVLDPRIDAAIPDLRQIADVLAPDDGRLAALHVTLTQAGLDVDVKGAGRGRTEGARAVERLASLADKLDLARLSIESVPMISRRTPWVSMGAAKVTLPPGAFLQATSAGEETLARLVLQEVAGANKVMDLFAGLGTFALRLTQQHQTIAIEGDAAMLAALKSAADAVGGRSGTIEVHRRDLFRAPVGPLEMKKIDAVVMDPPRAGARNQAEQLARSNVPTIVSVSCDPATFARDARLLVDGGWRLEHVTPVDQFHYSPHIELVGVFRK